MNEHSGLLRDLALFSVAINSKVGGRDLVRLAVTGLAKDDRLRERASVIQSKTKKPVQLERTENTQVCLLGYSTVTNFGLGHKRP